MIITTYQTQINEDFHNILVKEKSINYSIDTLNGPEKIVTMMNDIFQLDKRAEEHVFLIAVNAKNRPIGIFELSHGTFNCCILSPREVFIRLLLCGACHFFLVHNHPSGDISPTQDDIRTTERIEDAGKLMGVYMLDHIIVGNNYYSFKIQGQLNRGNYEKKC